MLDAAYSSRRTYILDRKWLGTDLNRFTILKVLRSTNELPSQKGVVDELISIHYMLTMRKIFVEKELPIKQLFDCTGRI